jgi:hypothetical protein
MGQIRYLGRKATGAILIGDVTKLSNGLLQVIGDKTFEYRSSGSPTAGNIAVAIGVDEATTVTTLIALINANKPTQACTASVDPVDNKVIRLAADAPGAQGNIALTNTVGDASYVNSAATLLGGDYGGKQFVEQGQYVVTALDVTAQNVMIPLEVASPRNLQVEVYSSTGAKKAITDLCTISGSFLKIAKTGGTNLAATDVVHYQVTNG